MKADGRKAEMVVTIVDKHDGGRQSLCSILLTVIKSTNQPRCWKYAASRSARKYISLAMAVSYVSYVPLVIQKSRGSFSLLFFFFNSKTSYFPRSLFFSLRGRRDMRLSVRTNSWLNAALVCSRPSFVPKLRERLDQIFSYRYREAFNSGYTCCVMGFSQILQRAFISERLDPLRSRRHLSWGGLSAILYEYREDASRSIRYLTCHFRAKESHLNFRSELRRSKKQEQFPSWVPSARSMNAFEAVCQRYLHTSLRAFYPVH